MLSKEDISEISAEVAEKVTMRVLTRLGLDAEEPLELQKDFAHLRAWRTSIDTAKGATIKAAISTLVAGAVGWLWLVWFKTPPPHVGG